MTRVYTLLAVVFFSTAVFGASLGERTLNGHVPEAARRLATIDRLPKDTQLRLAIGLPLRNQDQLNAFLQELYDPASPNYRHYLSPEEFTARFGPTEQDHQALIDFVTTNGFKVVKTHGNRMVVDVTASVGDIERSLHVTMRVFQHPDEARTFYAPDVEPSVPANLALADISGLANYALPHPRDLQVTSLENAPNATPRSGSGTNGWYLGNDFRAAYLPGVLLNGTGQTVGLLQFDGYHSNDIVAYANAAGLSVVPLQNVLLDGFTGTPGPNNTEVALDIEMVMAMAPGVLKIVVYEAGPAGIQNDILAAMVADTNVAQFSCSWGWTGGPKTTTDQLFQQMMAQGQSFLSASGDAGAFAPGAVDDSAQTNSPSSNPYITQVGGTSLTTTGPGGSWFSETTWRQSANVSSSGGVSSFYSIPNWQTNISMVANHGSTTARNIPDVALTAQNILLKYNNGSTASAFGTSCAAPLWAGFTALVNQQAAARGKQRIGFLNPALYAIGKGPNFTSDFHDVTTGSNTNSGSTANFSAVTGYDLCTGWGTPNGINLINALMPDDLQVSPTVGFTSTGRVGGPFSVTSMNLSLTNTGASSLNWALARPPVWLNVSPTNGSLTPGGPATTVTANLNAAVSNLFVGTYVTNLWFTNLNNNAVQSLQFNLIVQQLILNGGFETGDFTGWNVTADPSGYDMVKANLSSPPYPVHSGDYQAILAGVGSPSFLTQSIPTLSGQVYQVSFWVISDGMTPNEFLFNWNGQTIFDRVNIPATSGWTNLHFLVTATGNSTPVQFGVRDDPTWLGLDDVFVQPVPTPTLQSASRVGNGIQLGWSSLTGLVYQVQYKTNLNQTNWINLGSLITATNYSASISNAIATDPQRFYRIQLLP